MMIISDDDIKENKNKKQDLVDTFGSKIMQKNMNKMQRLRKTQEATLSQWIE